jgi:hypothetical protein
LKTFATILLGVVLACAPCAARDKNGSSRSLPATAAAATSSMSIPFLGQKPRLEDFEGMEPVTETARHMAKIDRFYQRDPHDGSPVSQHTEAYMGYDKTDLYVVFLAFDTDPKSIRAPRERRENINDDDQVGFFIDTFQDRRHAYFFFTNPLAVQQDGILTEGANLDLSFDTVWNARSKMTDRGYMVWFQIPFKSLRFPRAPEQHWGFFMERDIPRNSEHSFSPAISANAQGFITQEGTLEGIREISPGRNMQFIPYTSFRAFRGLDTRDPTAPLFTSRDFEAKAGLDAKVVLKDALVLDATINPDFGQVESDDPQVTVNQRFEVFFPEKRPFFQENSSYFDTLINLNFTRRIAEPKYGTRLTGKVGRWAIGALLVNDESPGDRVRSNDPLTGTNAYFGLLRLNYDVAKESTVGVIYADREMSTVPATICTAAPCITGFNRVGGLDGHFKLNKNWVLDFQGVESTTKFNDGVTISGPAFEIFTERNTRRMEFSTRYSDNSANFTTLTGFFRRPDTRRSGSTFRYSFFPKSKLLVRHGVNLHTVAIWDHNGTRLESTGQVNYNFVFPRQSDIGAFVIQSHEQLRPEDFSALPAVRDYPHHQQGVFVDTGYFKWMLLHGEIDWAGKDTNFDPSTGPPTRALSSFAFLNTALRPAGGLTIDNTYFLTRLRDPITQRNIFNNHIVRSKWNYQFNNQFSLRLIGQYTTTIANPALSALETTKNFNADLLFTYLIHPGTAVYVGYNSNLQNIDPSLGFDSSGNLLRTRTRYINDGRQLFVKISYLLRF